MSVSVIIPTFRRPGGIRAALTSVLAQSRLPDEVIVVDNDPAGSARDSVNALAASADVPVRYVHETRAGVSHARNSGLAAATGRYIAFLDDDEIASADWLSHLITSLMADDIDIVFGPISGVAADAGKLRSELTRRLYSRAGPASDTPLEKPFGCGNSAFDRAAFDLGETPFQTRFNEHGGEDDDFFAQLADQGGRFGWSAGAHVEEVVAPDRSRWAYLMARSFAFGQGPTQACHSRKDWPGVAFWMLVGLGQLAVFAPLAAITAVIGHEKAAGFVDKSAQAFGKIFWLQRFAPRFYGEAQLQAS